MSLTAYIVAGESYARCDSARDVFKSEASSGAPFERRRTLLVPTVCVGNVAQLAIDLILASIQDHAEHIAMLCHPLVLPCFGVNPYASRADQSNGEDTKGITSHSAHPMDLYRLNRAVDVTSGARTAEDSDVYILQQRAPASAGCQVAFSNDLMAWAREAGFDDVWILGSLSAEYRKDKDLARVDDVKFLCGESAGSLALGKECAEAGLSVLGDEYREMHDSEPFHMPWALLKAAGVTEPSEPAAGELRSAAILKFVLEGDNRMDAVVMAKAVGTVIGVDVDGRRVPSSWMHE